MNYRHIVLASIFATFTTGSGYGSNTIALAATRNPVRARHGMVASSNRLASQVGVEIMRRGGNAVDAAVAVAFTLAVTHPWAGNLGGGGFMLIRLHNGKTTAIDYRETAPGKATRNIYLNAQGKLIQGEGSSTVGYRAVGVPGTVAGMELAWKKYGSGNLTWSQLIEPARRLAAQGFRVSYRLAKVFQEQGKSLRLYRDSRKIFMRQEHFYHEGEVLRQPDLATTLFRLQRNGAREFYTGRTARLLATDMQQHHGLMSLADLRGYRAKERTPLRGTYRGYGIISMPPPSSGGAVLLEMLNILEGYNLSKLNPFSAQKYHLLTETMKRAYADRAEYMGDTDFVKLPIQGLIDKAYATRQRSTINLNHTTPSTHIKAGKPSGSEASETTHFTVVDKDGNAVSNTYTLNGYFGSGVVAQGTGIILNNEMDDFAAKPGVPNSYGLIQNERNAIAPHKRPLSSMTPTFVLHKDGSLWFAVGSPGGPTIINTVLQVIINVIDYHMDLQQAVDAPRIHHQWLPDEITYEPFGLSSDTRHILETMGHKFTTK
ncbi:MAG: gamma-glutamyltransferase, partial [Abitibacteriaceae bacterium]|nr:gamma-glutamyltransferase [Abditibacteriaceae bacterium]